MSGMRASERLLVAAVLLLPATPALADDQICTDRPSLTTAPCAVDGGHLQIETGLGDWTRETGPGGDRTDTTLIGETLLRYGLGGGWEARVDWTPYGIVRDRQDGMVTHSRGIGDVTLGVKKEIVPAPKGDGQPGFALTLLPQATLPSGHGEVGQGTWSAGLLVPVQYTISKALSLQATPEIDAAADDDGRGRHLAYGSSVTVALNVSDAVQLDATGEVLRDRDPDREVRGTRLLAGGAVAVLPSKTVQLDLGSNVGLNRASPDVEVYGGVSARF